MTSVRPMTLSNLNLSGDDLEALLLGRPNEVIGRLPDWLADGRRRGDLPVVAVDPLPGLPQAVDYMTALSKAVGALLPQGFDGELVREVRDRSRSLTEQTSRYSDTRFGGDLHTDGFHRPGDVPDVFALYCHRKAATGGALVLVPVAEVLARLDSAVVAVLTQSFQIDTRDAGPGDAKSVIRPVLDLSGPSPRMYYLRRYITGTGDGSRLGGHHQEALDALDSILGDETLHRHTTLAPGEVAFVDNLRFIHGRTEFSDLPDPAEARLLLRTWISTHN